MTDTRWDRWAAASGVVFVVLALAAFLFAYDLPTAGDSNEQILSYFRENDTAVTWQAFLFGLAAIAFVWFFGTIAASIRKAEADPAGRLPAIVVIAAATTAGLYLVGIGVTTTLAKTAETIEAGTAGAIYELSSTAFTLTDFTAATITFAIAVAIVRTGLLPASSAYAAAAVGVLLIVHSAGALLSDSDAFGPGGIVGVIAFLAFLAWTLTASWLLMQRVAAESPAPRMAPT